MSFPVDVPVVDLDEQDDTFSFRDSPGEPRHEPPFLDPLDYKNPSRPGVFSRVRDYFVPSYTSVPDSDDQADHAFFSVDDDSDSDSAAGPEPGLRNYKIKRLNQKLNRTILAFACSLVFVFGLFFLRRDAQAGSGAKRVLSNGTHNFNPTTIVVSLDGFHPHYISSDLTPALHKMLVEDYGPPYMTPSFPSSTFPNHWTLVTGLYPAEHGIVGNTFFDPELQKQFINTDPAYGLDPDFWRGGEPLWTTASRQGVKSAIHMWPGSEVPTIGDNGPMEIDRYNGSELLSAKVDRVMRWLDVEDIEQRPELVLTYVPTIDQYGHKYGVAGQNLSSALQYVDDFVALMRRSLSERNLDKVANLVFLSDHGMAATSNDRLLFLDDVVSLDKIEHIDGWPLFGLRPHAQYSVDEIYNEILKSLAQMEDKIKNNFNVYKVEDIPPEWNFGGQLDAHRFNYRLAPVWIVPNVGYSVTTHVKFREANNQYYPRGVHGYNNTHLLMRALFVGSGPYFEKKLRGSKKVLPFTNVNVYNIVCDSLDLRPSPNNGTAAGKQGYSVSSSNQLPANWQDTLVYPDLPYEIDHLVKNATYDLLWRSADAIKVAEANENPHALLISEEATMSSISVALPKASDFMVEPEKVNEQEEIEKEIEEEEEEEIEKEIEEEEEEIEKEVEEQEEEIEKEIEEGEEEIEAELEDEAMGEGEEGLDQEHAGENAEENPEESLLDSILDGLEDTVDAIGETYDEMVDSVEEMAESIFGDESD